MSPTSLLPGLHMMPSVITSSASGLAFEHELPTIQRTLMPQVPFAPQPVDLLYTNRNYVSVWTQRLTANPALEIPAVVRVISDEIKDIDKHFEDSLVQCEPVFRENPELDQSMVRRTVSALFHSQRRNMAKNVVDFWLKETLEKEEDHLWRPYPPFLSRLQRLCCLRPAYRFFLLCVQAVNTCDPYPARSQPRNVAVENPEDQARFPLWQEGYEAWQLQCQYLALCGLRETGNWGQGLAPSIQQKALWNAMLNRDPLDIINFQMQFEWALKNGFLDTLQPNNKNSLDERLERMVILSNLKSVDESWSHTHENIKHIQKGICAIGDHNRRLVRDREAWKCILTGSETPTLNHIVPQAVGRCIYPRAHRIEQIYAKQTYDQQMEDFRSNASSRASGSTGSMVATYPRHHRSVISQWRALLFQLLRFNSPLTTFVSTMFSITGLLGDMAHNLLLVHQDCEKLFETGAWLVKFFYANDINEYGQEHLDFPELQDPFCEALDGFVLHTKRPNTLIRWKEACKAGKVYFLIESEPNQVAAGGFDRSTSPNPTSSLEQLRLNPKPRLDSTARERLVHRLCRDPTDEHPGFRLVFKFQHHSLSGNSLAEVPAAPLPNVAMFWANMFCIKFALTQSATPSQADEHIRLLVKGEGGAPRSTCVLPTKEWLYFNSVHKAERGVMALRSNRDRTEYDTPWTSDLAKPIPTAPDTRAPPSGPTLHQTPVHSIDSPKIATPPPPFFGDQRYDTGGEPKGPPQNALMHNQAESLVHHYPFNEHPTVEGRYDFSATDDVLASVSQCWGDFDDDSTSCLWHTIPNHNNLPYGQAADRQVVSLAGFQDYDQSLVPQTRGQQPSDQPAAENHIMDWLNTMEEETLDVAMEDTGGSSSLLVHDDFHVITALQTANSSRGSCPATPSESGTS